jgi:hypothetical protein
LLTISLSIADGDLRLFAPFGNVVRAQVARTRMGEPLWFAYVEMEKGDQADSTRRVLNGARFPSVALHVSDAWLRHLTTDPY